MIITWLKIPQLFCNFCIRFHPDPLIIMEAKSRHKIEYCGAKTQLQTTHTHPLLDWQLNYTWSSKKGCIMSEIIDKTMVLLSTKERKPEQIQEHEQSCFSHCWTGLLRVFWLSFYWSHPFLFDMWMLKVVQGQRFSYCTCILNGFYLSRFQNESW